MLICLLLLIGVSASNSIGLFYHFIKPVTHKEPIVSACAGEFIYSYEGYEVLEILERSERSTHRLDNATCTDLCLEEMSNYTNGLQTNTSITIYPDGKVLVRLAPVDFEHICPIYARALPCMKKCKDPETPKLITGFGEMTYLCVDKYKEIKPHYKCLLETINKDPRPDVCVTECFQNATKTHSVNDGNEKVQDCSSFKCLVKCGLNTVKKNCKSDAVKIARGYAKVQLDLIEKTAPANQKWPKECTQLQKDLSSDKPLV